MLLKCAEWMILSSSPSPKCICLKGLHYMVIEAISLGPLEKQIQIPFPVIHRMWQKQLTAHSIATLAPSQLTRAAESSPKEWIMSSLSQIWKSHFLYQILLFPVSLATRNDQLMQIWPTAYKEGFARGLVGKTFLLLSHSSPAPTSNIITWGHDT